MQNENLAHSYRLNRRQLLTFGAATLAAFALEGTLWRTGQAATDSSSAAMPSMQTLPNALALQSVQPAVSLTGITHTWQTLNNCGPAVLAMNFSYYGKTQDQQIIAKTLRPNASDENVRSDEVANYAITQGYQATLRVNGNADQMRLLLSNGIPVIIETWASDNPSHMNDGFAHFRLVTGYDDARQVWIVYDSYIARNLVNPEGEYEGMYVSYAQADQLWRVMNRKYVVMYTAVQAPLVQTILGATLNDQTMWQGSLAQAQAEQAEQPDDAFAWFNYGSSLYATNQPNEALTAFLKAATLGLPTRMFWYQYEPFEAYYAAGRYTELVQFVDHELATATGLEELYYWKALGLAALDQPEQATLALQQALFINPNYAQARIALETKLVA
ncbi:MAG: C39 family peptidase [Chloroflexi bacterium]|nr:C39 family peptidase [Chloroflexota bacterium]